MSLSLRASNPVMVGSNSLTILRISAIIEWICGASWSLLTRYNRIEGPTR